MKSKSHIMKLKVAILQCHSIRKKHLDGYFASDFFEIHHIPLAAERDQILSALEKADDSYILIIKDTSVTVLPSVEDIIRYILVRNHSNFDIFYLGKWLDRCDLYRNKEVVPYSTASIVATSCPQGLQAAIFSPKGSNIILGRHPMNDGGYFKATELDRLTEQITNNILSGNIKALCYVPNIFDFNVLEAKDDKDFAKTEDCQIPVPIKHPDNEGWVNLWSYVIIFIVILLISVVLYYLITGQR